MRVMFGKTESEILEAIEFYEKYHPKRTIVLIQEHVGIDGQNFKLETWSDKGLTLWVNGHIVYQHNDLQKQEVLREAESVIERGSFVQVDFPTVGKLVKLIERLVKIIKKD